MKIKIMNFNSSSALKNEIRKCAANYRKRGYYLKCITLDCNELLLQFCRMQAGQADSLYKQNGVPCD